MHKIIKSVAKLGAKKAPEILLGAGFAAIGVGTVKACLTTKDKLPKIEEEYRRELKASESSEAGRRFVLKAIGAYSIPTAIIGAGMACIVFSNSIQKSRLLGAFALYNTTLAAFNEYRARVIEKEGEAADMAYLAGHREVKAIKVKKDKDGTEKETEQKATILGSGNGDSLYHRCFDNGASTQWCNDPDYNLKFLLTQQRIANDSYHSRGYLFLDEVYNALGFSLDGYSNAKLVGWIKHDGGDDYVDFGIYDESKNRDATLRFLSGDEPTIWLNFNCDGIIIDKI